MLDSALERVRTFRGMMEFPEITWEDKKDIRQLEFDDTSNTVHERKLSGVPCLTSYSRSIGDMDDPRFYQQQMKTCE
jgi:hypothetical protein